jgi:hypothetical protein
LVDVSARGGFCEEEEAILDGGSSYSLMSSALARRLNPQIDFKQRIRFKGVKGTVSTSIGAASLVVRLAGKKIRRRFHVAPEPPEGADPGWSLIIGTDFCKAAGLNIDYLNEVVCWQGPEATCSGLLLREPLPEPFFAVLDACQGTYVDLPPGKLCDLPVCIGGKGRFVLTERDESRLPPDLKVYDALTKTTGKGRSKIRVKNIGSGPIRLYGQQKIAAAERMAPKAVFASASRALVSTRPKQKASHRQRHVVGLEKVDLSHLEESDRHKVRAKIKKFPRLFPPPECSTPPAVKARPIHIDTGSALQKIRKTHR